MIPKHSVILMWYLNNTYLSGMWRFGTWQVMLFAGSSLEELGIYRLSEGWVSLWDVCAWRVHSPYPLPVCRFSFFVVDTDSSASCSGCLLQYLSHSGTLDGNLEQNNLTPRCFWPWYFTTRAKEELNIHSRITLFHGNYQALGLC